MSTLTQIQTEAFYSDFADDPDMSELVEMFVEEMPKRAEIIEQALSTGNWDRLRVLAHQLKGSGGSHGFDGLSVIAGRVEGLVKTAPPKEGFLPAVLELVDYCRRMKSGQAPQS